MRKMSRGAAHTVAIDCINNIAMTRVDTANAQSSDTRATRFLRDMCVHRTAVAMIGINLDIAALWVLLALTLYAFMYRSKPAGLLMLPYIGWVSFAAVLNFSIWRMN